MALTTMDKNWLKQRGLLERPQVWLVADSHQDLLIILDALSHHELSDWDVDMILDWHEVLEKSYASPCDVILLSVQNEDPFALLDAVRADPSPDSPLGGVPVIVFVPPGQEESLAARALRRGAWDYGVLGEMTPFALHHRVVLALKYQDVSLHLHWVNMTRNAADDRPGADAQPTPTLTQAPARPVDAEDRHWGTDDFAPQPAETIAHLTAENRHWQRTLRQQEATYQYLFEHHPQPLWVFDCVTLYFLAVNAAAIAKYGYSEAEFLAMTVADIHDPRDVPQLLNFLAQEEDGLTLVGIRQHQCKDGQFILVEISSHRVEFQGRACRLVWINDVTARTLAEQELIQLNTRLEQKVTLRATELLEQEMRLQAILDAAPELIAIKDLDDRHILANPAVLNLFNMSASEFLGKRTAELFPPATTQRLQAHDQQLLATGAVQQFEATIVVNGVEHIFWVSKFLLKDYQGRPTGIGSIATEVTERKRTEMHLAQVNRELLRATQLKDEFLARMSHELRTPLNAILGMTEALQEQVFGNVSDRQIKALNTIERSSTHLLDLITDILDIAKIESGQEVLHRRAQPIAPLCEASMALVKAQALRKGIDLYTTISPTLSSAVLDECRIRQVLVNLLSNAVKFTDPGGRVCLTVTAVSRQTAHPQEGRSGQGIQFEVTDTGVGIRAEDLQRVFQAFVQVDGNLNHQHGGTGLGLALVKHLVELHDGTVTVESEVGVGSCFRVVLPLEGSGSPSAAPPSQDAAAGGAAPPPLAAGPGGSGDRPAGPGSARILVVEDNDANLMSLVDYLMAKGYEVWTAASGEAAIALIQARLANQADQVVPDVILMDVQMPNLDGFETTRRLRQNPRLAQVPIVMWTALATPGDRERGLAVGADDYLVKPMPLKALNQRIQHWLHPTPTGPD